MKNKVSGNKMLQMMLLFFSAVLLFAAWCTLHDMQRSEGIGLYYSMILGFGGASGMGFAAEAVGMAVLLGLLLVPCILFRRLKPECFLRLLTAYLAFLPSVSLAYLVHLFDGTEKISCSEALLAGNLGQALAEGMAGIIPVLSAGIPLMILAAFVIKEREGEVLQNTAVRGVSEEEIRKENTEENILKKRPVKALSTAIIAVITGILLAAAVVFPALKGVSDFFVRYLLLVCGFGLWEKLYELCPQYKNWGWLIFGIFGLRGIYIMAEVMSVYHI